MKQYQAMDFTFLPPPGPLKLYPGQPDPKDESKFSIRYTIGNKEGFIDGQLQADDTVKMQLRPGSP